MDRRSSDPTQRSDRRRVAPGKLWAVNVVRTVPGKGVQAWSGPAGVNPRPEGMGILTFVAVGSK